MENLLIVSRSLGGNRAINLNFAQFTKIIYLLKASSLLKKSNLGHGGTGKFPGVPVGQSASGTGLWLLLFWTVTLLK